MEFAGWELCTFEALIWNNSPICDVMLFIASLLVLMSHVCSSVTMFAIAIFVSSKFCTKHSYSLGFIYVCWLIFFRAGSVSSVSAFAGLKLVANGHQRIIYQLLQLRSLVISQRCLTMLGRNLLQRCLGVIAPICLSCPYRPFSIVRLLFLHMSISLKPLLSFFLSLDNLFRFKLYFSKAQFWSKKIISLLIKMEML